MRTRKKSPSNKLGFSLVEMLITLGIIAVLVGLLVPALNMAHDMALKVKQQMQFTGIGIALEAFASDSGYGDYPPSNNNQYITAGDNYTGTQKLAEALIGLDGFGWHPDSIFATHGMEYMDGSGKHLYYPSSHTAEYTPAEIEDNLRSRMGPYLDLDKVGAIQLGSIYGSTLLTANLFDTQGLVLTDVYGTVRHADTGSKVGSPILYYRANTTGTSHDGASFAPGAAPAPTDYHPHYYYEFFDNQALLRLGTPDGETHPMDGDWQWFYEHTTNPKITQPAKPYNDDTFILQSAGPDGLYGTQDDVFNFNTGGY